MTFLGGQWQAEAASLSWKTIYKRKLKGKAKSQRNDINNGILDRIDSSYFKRKEKCSRFSSWLNNLLAMFEALIQETN